MPLPIKSFDQLVSDQVTAIQGASTVPFDFSTGSTILSLVEANASMGIWLEFLINYTLSLAYSDTSSGADLDTWMAQFRFTRLPASNATGNVDFSRFTGTGSVFIPADGSVIVKTTNFLQSYIVSPDTSNPNYSASLNGYTMNAGVLSMPVKVIAETAGTAGNAIPNTITVIASPISGIDNVDNPTAITNGKNAESDDAFRARFILYINSLSRAVRYAAAYALSNIQEITRFGIFENVSYTGQSSPGFFYAVIDDGTGNPPPSLIAQANAAIEPIRGLSIMFGVYPPLVLNVDVSVTLQVTFNLTHLEAQALVTTSLTNYINNLGFGVVLPFSKLYEIIYETSPYITNATGLLVNGNTADLPAVNNQIFVAGTINVSFI